MDRLRFTGRREALSPDRCEGKECFRRPPSGPSRRLAIGPSQDVASGPLRTAGALLLSRQDEDLDLETDNDENSDVDSNDEKEANHIPIVKDWRKFLLLPHIHLPTTS